MQRDITLTPLAYNMNLFLIHIKTEKMYSMLHLRKKKKIHEQNCLHMHRKCLVASVDKGWLEPEM